MLNTPLRKKPGSCFPIQFDVESIVKNARDTIGVQNPAC